MLVFNTFPAWSLPLIGVVAVSAWDDRRDVSPLVRLVVHVGAALAWALGVWPHAGGLVAALTVVWGANLFNFMDGSDGLAALMASVGFGSYAVAVAMTGGNDFALLASIVGATLPVLALNWPPARVFLGDTGSVPLGFLAAVLGMQGWRSGAWPAWFPLFVFLPFIADATVTLARRAWQRKRIWEAHREHSYQRLVQLGAGHAGTLAIYGTLMVAGASVALACLRTASAVPRHGALLALAWLSILLLVFSVIDFQWRARCTELR